MERYLEFTRMHLLFLVSSIFTYLADITFGIVLAATFLSDGYLWYVMVVSCLIAFPTALVQVFSLRWHKLDETTDGPTWAIHSFLMGVTHRYLVVISLGLTAMRSGADSDYQQYYQQQSDVCMLRLFHSFLLSAPLVVFQLYVATIKSYVWPPPQLMWTCLSGIVTAVSLYWGIAAYCSSTRMTSSEGIRGSWKGTALQTIWRFATLSARIVALVLLTVAIHEWIVIVMFVHWLVMTLWIIFQDTDFCSNVWEERMYNAVVGIIYCFCFFNLKEGSSRCRSTIFYLIIVAENFAFVFVFYCYADLPIDSMKDTMALAASAVIGAGTLLGLSSMLLYYRFFHPSGPISLCAIVCLDEHDKKDIKLQGSRQNGGLGHDVSRGPDFEIRDYAESANYARQVRRSRSFKLSANRRTPQRQIQHAAGVSRFEASSASPTQATTDSAYGTDSNRTASRNAGTVSPGVNEDGDEDAIAAEKSGSSGSSQAFNNETYMSVEEEAAVMNNTSANKTYVSVGSGGDTTSDFSQRSAESRITVINKHELLYATPSKKKDRNNESDVTKPEKLLKRSPVVKDVTEVEENGEVAKGGPKGLAGPLTIIIPNISHQAFARSSNTKSGTIDYNVNSGKRELGARQLSGNEVITLHDYENLALININRSRLGVSHWRTYSDMADGKHDESTAYEKNKKNKSKNSDYSNYGSLQYYDIYPLSREMKEQLYRSLTPVSTSATVAASGSDNSNNHETSSSDTYEPIETIDAKANASSGLTLIRHDGQKMSTRQIASLDNLRQILQEHESVPMDDPQDRGDLYLLAPMRLLTPIIEEEPTSSDLDTTTFTECSHGKSGHNRSILTVISEILNASGSTGYARVGNMAGVARKEDLKCSNVSSAAAISRVAELFAPDEGVESTSSLVHTIEEMKNNSLCNLFYSSFTDLSLSSEASLRHRQQEQQSSSTAAVPQVPPRNGAGDPPKHCAKSSPEVSRPLSSPVKSIKSNTLLPSPSASPKPALPSKTTSPPTALLSSTSAGTRKNIMVLAAGQSQDFLNTPRRPEKIAWQNASSSPNLGPLQQKTVLSSATLSKLSLCPPQVASTPEASMHKQQQRQPSASSLRSGGSMFLRELSMSLSPSSKYETPTPPLRPNQFVRSYNSRPPRKRTSIQSTAAANQDLYQNISDDLLHADLSIISTRSMSTPFLDSRCFELKADERYENLQRGWATSSTRYHKENPLRRSLSRLEGLTADKENNRPSSPPPPVGPKPSMTRRAPKEMSRGLEERKQFARHSINGLPHPRTFGGGR